MQLSYTTVAPVSPPPQFHLTVVTVCRNDLAGLKETTRSVLRQKALGSLTIEHIVIDGQSDDGTPAWLAEMHRTGQIEAYVSEPDRGIYDAMNKGINMAQGEVIAFLNANDTYTETDIACCVHPIREKKTCHTVGTACLRTSAPAKVLKKSTYNTNGAFLVTPCCHQAYFADTELYRALGGYDAEHFRCCADGIFINAVIARHGEPMIIRHDVVNFAMGGFSDACGIRFVDEFIRLQWLYHEKAMARARQDRAYARALAASLIHHYRNLSSCMEKQAIGGDSLLEMLRTMCREAAELPIGSCHATLLLALAERHIPRLSRRKTNRPGHPWHLHLATAFCAERLTHPSHLACYSLLKVCYRDLRTRLRSLTDSP